MGQMTVEQRYELLDLAKGLSARAEPSPQMVRPAEPSPQMVRPPRPRIGSQTEDDVALPRLPRLPRVK